MKDPRGRGRLPDGAPAKALGPESSARRRKPVEARLAPEAAHRPVPFVVRPLRCSTVATAASASCRKAGWSVDRGDEQNVRTGTQPERVTATRGGCHRDSERRPGGAGPGAPGRGGRRSNPERAVACGSIGRSKAPKGREPQERARLKQGRGDRDGSKPPRPWKRCRRNPGEAWRPRRRDGARDGRCSHRCDASADVERDRPGTVALKGPEAAGTSREACLRARWGRCPSTPGGAPAVQDQSLRKGRKATGGAARRETVAGLLVGKTPRAGTERSQGRRWSGEANSRYRRGGRLRRHTTTFPVAGGARPPRNVDA